MIPIECIYFLFGGLSGFLVRWFLIEKFIHAKTEVAFANKMLEDELEKNQKELLEYKNKYDQLLPSKEFIESLSDLSFNDFKLHDGKKEYCMECLLKGKLSTLTTGNVRTTCPECNG